MGTCPWNGSAILTNCAWSFEWTTRGLSYHYIFIRQSESVLPIFYFNFKSESRFFSSVDIVWKLLRKICNKFASPARIIICKLSFYLHLIATEVFEIALKWFEADEGSISQTHALDTSQVVSRKVLDHSLIKPSFQWVFK